MVPMKRIYLLVAFLFIAGCDRFYGPAFYNRTAFDASIEYRLSGKVMRLQMTPHKSFSQRYPPQGELESVSAVYADGRVFALTSEDLAPVLEANGGSKYVLIVIEVDGIRATGGKEATRILQSDEP